MKWSCYLFSTPALIFRIAPFRLLVMPVLLSLFGEDEKADVKRRRGSVEKNCGSVEVFPPTGGLIASRI